MKKLMIILLTGVVLVACNSKKEEVSVAYYKAHVDEAKQEDYKCLVASNDENPNSCNNARTALRELLEARQKKDSDEFDQETQNINDAFHKKTKK